MDPWSVFSSYRGSVSWPVPYAYQGFISIPTKMGGIGQLPPYGSAGSAGLVGRVWVVGILFFLFCVLLTPMSSRSTVYCWMGVLTKALGRSPFAFQFLEKH